MSKTACAGILRQAHKRGKELPPVLREALEIQAGLREPPDGHCPEAPIVFACNQRDEVRDLHDVSGAIQAQPGMKQQTFVAAGFCAGASPTAGNIGWQEECAPTLKASESGTNMVLGVCVPQVARALTARHDSSPCADRGQNFVATPIHIMATQQGGAEIGVGVCPTITASAGMSGNNQPVVFDHHPNDARLSGPVDAAQTVTENFGAGGNNTPLAVTFSMQRSDEFRENNVVMTQSARQHKSATDLICQPEVSGLDCRNLRENGNLSGTLQAKPNGGQSLNTTHPVRVGMVVRRLTPLECERLQGFPDGWTDIPGASDSARYKSLGNAVAIPCVEFVMRGIAAVLENEERIN